MSRNRLIDAATGEEYVWEVNHTAVGGAARGRQIATTFPTGAIGDESVRPIRQQGEDLPEIHRLEGLAPASQHETLIRFWKICARRTVHFVSFTGERYEVRIRSYNPTTQRIISGPRGARLRQWRYTLELEIVARIA